ncbi:MAG: hypothetical protein AB1896_12470 [Thermodesulfobacteriota bacterium]
MPRDVLIVNESARMRKTLAGFVMAEFSGAVIKTASTGDEGLKALANQRFDLVLVSGGRAGGNPADLFRRLQEQGGPNEDTPFLVVAFSPSGEEKKSWEEAGFKQLLSGPLDGARLAEAVTMAEDPRNKRISARYSLEGAKAVLRFEERVLEADLLNLSLTGALCQMPCPAGLAGVISARRMDLHIPFADGWVQAADILTSVQRLEVLEQREGFDPAVIRVAHRFEQVPEEAGRILEGIMEYLPKQLETQLEL